MIHASLTEKIKLETGISVSSSKDIYLLAGIFNKYRPDGEGLNHLFSDHGLERQVCERIKRIFSVTALEWRPNDLYFSIKRFGHIEREMAIEITQKYLDEIKKFSELINDSDAINSLSTLRVASDLPTPDILFSDDMPTLIYELITDFFAKLQPERHELFMLKEAFYSMANDYFLMAYILWPVIQAETGSVIKFDSYFEIWRNGITLNFSEDGMVFVNLPK